MNKQNQKNIMDLITKSFDEEFEKVNLEKQKLLEEKNANKEKMSILDKENKELKAKVKQLEKDLSIADKKVQKYEKVFSAVK